MWRDYKKRVWGGGTVGGNYANVGDTGYEGGMEGNVGVVHVVLTQIYDLRPGASGRKKWWGIGQTLTTPNNHLMYDAEHRLHGF